MKDLEEKENNKNEVDSLNNILDNISIINKTVDNMMKDLYLIMFIMILLVIVIFILLAFIYFPI